MLAEQLPLLLTSWKITLASVEQSSFINKARPYGFLYYILCLQNVYRTHVSNILFSCWSDIVYSVPCCLIRGVVICPANPTWHDTCMPLALKSSACFWMCFLIKSLRSKLFTQYAWLPPLQSTISCNLFIDKKQETDFRTLFRWAYGCRVGIH